MLSDYDRGVILREEELVTIEFITKSFLRSLQKLVEVNLSGARGHKSDREERIRDEAVRVVVCKSRYGFTAPIGGSVVRF